MSVSWLVFCLKGSPTSRADRGIRNDAATRLCETCRDGVPCGLVSTEKPVMNPSWTRGMSEGRLSWRSSSQFEESWSGRGMQKPPKYTPAYPSLYPWRFIQAKGPQVLEGKLSNEMFTQTALSV